MNQDAKMRSIFSDNLGWFNGNADTLYPMPQDEALKREIQLMGGIPELKKQVAEALKHQESQWAIHLLAKIRDSKTVVGGELKWLNQNLADAYDQQAMKTQNSNGRAYLLESSHELQNGWKKLPAAIPDDELLTQLDLEELFKRMSIQLVPEKAMDTEETVLFDFPDVPKKIYLTVRHGVAEIAVTDPFPGSPEPVARLETDSLTWKRLAVKKDSLIKVIAQGKLKVRGSQLKFMSFMKRFAL